MVDYQGRQLGNYRLLQPLGRGGYAQVYLGEHVFLKRQAAIKVLHAAQLSDTELEAFLNEARTIARLEHPNIVRILDFGIEGYIPFLVMSYAPKGSLRDLYAGDRRPSLPTVVSYVKQIASALQHAHNEKQIHRDVKPENLLLGQNNEVLLTDFGIVTVAYSTSKPFQKTQDITGTIPYMAPEQIHGKPRPASDQYALGIIVYEWLCGERPFHGTLTELFSQHLFVPPPPLREKAPDIPADVEQVVLTALAKDPKDRFGSVTAFANALEQASSAVAPTIYVPPSRPSSPLPSLKPLLGSTLYTYRSPGWISTVAWSPDGKRIAFGTWDNTVQVWAARHRGDVSDQSAVYTYRGHAQVVKAVAWSPDGRRIASGSWDDTLQVWDATTGENALTCAGHAFQAEGLAWSPDGSRIATAHHDGTVLLWNVLNGSNIFTYRGHTDLAWAVAWSPEGKRIASASHDGTVQVWDALSGSNVFAYRGHAAPASAVAWSPDGKRIASTGRDGTVQVWDALNGSNVLIYRGHANWVSKVAWSPDSKYIASGAETVQVWDSITGESIFIYPGHSDWVNAVAWSPEGQRIASASDDQTVQVWQAV